MADSDDEDEKNVVFDIVDDAVITLADAVRPLLGIRQRFDTMRARVVREGVNRWSERCLNGARQFSQLTRCGRRKFDGI